VKIAENIFEKHVCSYPGVHTTLIFSQISRILIVNLGILVR